MAEQSLQEQIEAINRKLDLVLEEVALQQRHRREMEDLKDDLTRLARGVYKDAVQELEDVHDHLNTGDVLSLLKKLLRNVNTISRTIEQMEGVRDFLQDAAPLARESFLELMQKLDALDRKGYFLFLKESARVLDTIVTTFSADDVRRLGENIVTILTTVKNLTQPDILNAVNNALTVYRTVGVKAEEEVKLLALLKELNSPEARRGLAFTVNVLKGIAAPKQENMTAVHDKENP